MSLQVTSYPDPTSTTPISDAYAWIPRVTFDFATGNGTIQVQVNRDAASASAGLPPVTVLYVGLGQPLINSSLVLPSIAAMMGADASVAAAFQTIRTYLYTQLQTLAPFAGSTQVT